MFKRVMTRADKANRIDKAKKIPLNCRLKLFTTKCFVAMYNMCVWVSECVCAKHYRRNPTANSLLKV